MLKRILALALATVPVFALAPRAYALDPGTFSVGYGVGLSQLYQFSSTVDFRGHPWGPLSESIVSIDTHAQVLSPDATYAIESTGLSYSLGGRFAFVRGGLSVEGAALKRVLQKEPASNQLQFTYGWGFLLEPYLAVVLPVFDTKFTETDLMLKWPVMSPDPAIGPRLVLTIWAGASETETHQNEPAPSEAPAGE